MENVALAFEQLMRLSPREQAVHTVGVNYDGSADSLEKLCDLDFDKSSSVAMAHVQSYSDSTLARLIGKILLALGMHSRLAESKRIVIKIGLVEGRTPTSHVTPHPAVLRGLLAAIRAVRGSLQGVCVAEGTGHERDTAYVLRETGIDAVEHEYSVGHVDLNLDDLVRLEHQCPVSMTHFFLPVTVVEADFLISLAKLKTHHRSGVSLGMKNLFGLVPGSVYGFPKTRLHYAGVARVIADLADLAPPDLTILDGVVAMEGTGPLDGTPITAGTLIGGTSVATTDAAATKLMGFSPLLVPQFWYANRKGLLRRPNVVHVNERSSSARTLPLAFEAPSNISWLKGSDQMNRPAKMRLLGELLSEWKPAVKHDSSVG